MSDPHQEYRVFVVELSDDYGPRVHPERPNLWIGKTIRSRSEAFHHFKTTRHGVHAIRLRTDLTRGYRTTTSLDADRQKRKLARKLRRRGHVVNGRGELRRVYVGRLSDDVGSVVARMSASRGCTWVSPRSHPRRVGDSISKGPATRMGLSSVALSTGTAWS